ncbi:MAG: cation:proton antiporter [Chitinophagaceae bacterium]|nr:cation:proton antiporter [Chitinophagaceae bacterium]
MNTYYFILAACLLIICSYLINLFTNKRGIPAVLLLLLLGIGARELLQYYHLSYPVPQSLVELLGIIGLIMIVLEAGLDITITSSYQLKLVKNAFLSALFILLLSAAVCAAFLYYYLHEPLINCIVYSLPFSIVSSAIVLPSVSHLSDWKKEFLVYETSFSDILGILIFNYIIAGSILEVSSISWFFGSIILGLLLSVVISLILLYLLTHISTRVRFFLVFAVLIFLYAAGKLLHLPALVIILLFGLLVSNFQNPLFTKFRKWINSSKAEEVHHLLHGVTAETSFIVRTFFFFLFGFSIDIHLLTDVQVLVAGSFIVLLLFMIRYLYLRFFLKAHILPELFFMPRGLITILLFYSIPSSFRLQQFNEGILLFIILATGLIMTAGSLLYGNKDIENINDEIPVTEQV